MSEVREVAELGTLSAQRLRARLEADDGERVMVIGDEDARIEISAEIGSRADAVRALEDVAGAILAWAQELRRPAIPEYPRLGEAPASWI